MWHPPKDEKVEIIEVHAVADDARGRHGLNVTFVSSTFDSFEKFLDLSYP